MTEQAQERLVGFLDLGVVALEVLGDREAVEDRQRQGRQRLRARGAALLGCRTERVAEAFAKRKPSRVVRYDLPKLSAFNFVLDDALEGGVNASLGLDGHGKSLSFLLLEIPLQLPKQEGDKS